MIRNSNVKVDFTNGSLQGEQIVRKETRLKEIQHIFEKRVDESQLDPETIVYEVEYDSRGENHQPGGLLFGRSILHPGKVNDEYFMTKGHFHQQREQSEFYWGIQGKGILLLMDEDKNTSAEIVEPGSLHYIPGYTAHRLINTSDEVLIVGACWSADAGHDYDTILTEGFSKRVKNIDGRTQLV